jgi:hypothetical protein
LILACNLADLLLLERLDGRGDSEVGFAGAGRAAAEHEVMCANGFDVLGLARRFGPDDATGLADIDGRRAAVRWSAGDLANNG